MRQMRPGDEAMTRILLSHQRMNCITTLIGTTGMMSSTLTNIFIERVNPAP